MSSYRGNSSRNRGYPNAENNSSGAQRYRNERSDNGSSYRQGDSSRAQPSRFQNYRKPEQSRPHSSLDRADGRRPVPAQGGGSVATHPSSRFDKNSNGGVVARERDYNREDYRHKESIYRGGIHGGVRSSDSISRTRSEDSERPYKRSRFDSSSRPSAPQAQLVHARPQLILPSKPAKKFDIVSKDLAFLNLKQCGEGTYGKVYKVENLNRQGRRDNLVAIKRLRLENERDGFPITSIREVKLLQRMSTKYNNQNISILNEILVLKEESIDPNVQTKDSINMVFDYCQMDLFSFLEKTKIDLTMGNTKNIAKQLLTGMDFLHSNNIIHRDIKPSNILINGDGTIKITDFGLARIVSKSHEIDATSGVNGLLTNRVITLWYRPIELLLGSTNYSYEVDMWGCGCLLLQLINKKSPFQGMSDIQTLYDIIYKLGIPNTENFPKLFEYPWTFLMLNNLSSPKTNNSKYNESENIYATLQENDELDFLDIIQKLLKYDPLQRISAGECLKSKCFQSKDQIQDLEITKDQEYHEYEVKKERREQRKIAAKLR